MTPEQRLARAVIGRALRDLLPIGLVSSLERADAREFLAGGEALEFWIGVSGLRGGLRERLAQRAKKGEERDDVQGGDRGAEEDLGSVGSDRL